MISLPDVTLVCVDGRQNSNPSFYHYSPPGNLFWPIKYAEYIHQYIQFGKYVIITPEVDRHKHDLIEFKPTCCFGYKGYSQFMVLTLKDYITTEFCLVYQEDGFICNPHLWDDAFLQYDYIGAPWRPDAPLPNKCRSSVCRVGNGGFSLRSKKFIETSAKIGFCNSPEDSFILCKALPFMLENGIKLPSCEIAKKFSVEYPLDENHNTSNTFGFHKGRYQTNDFVMSFKNKIMEGLRDDDKID